jgi:hypothetical protein
MAVITKNKGNGKNKVMLTDKELNTITMALALINIPDMEAEMKEQGLTEDQVEFNHLGLFEPFAKVTKLYPQKTASEVESQ